MPVFDRPGAPAAADREPAEQLIGRALRGRRDEVVIATKSNGIVGHGVNDRGLSRGISSAKSKRGLRRLETDYIDLYYAHDPTRTHRWSRPLAAYDDLIRQGKIRYVGLSNHPAWLVTRALWIADDRRLNAPVAVQVSTTSSTGPLNASLRPPASSSGCLSSPTRRCTVACLPVLMFSPGTSLEISDSRVPFPESEIAIAREVERLSRAWGLQLYRSGFAWLLSRPAVASVIVGPRP